MTYPKCYKRGKKIYKDFKNFPKKSLFNRYKSLAESNNIPVSTIYAIIKRFRNLERSGLT